VQAPELGPRPEVRFEAWLMRGAVREDDLAQSVYPRGDTLPDIDPWKDQNRPATVSHFYIPITNLSGMVPFENPFFNPPTALQGAMGTAGDPLQANPVPDLSRGNHFSYLDARRNMFMALTYKVPGSAVNSAGNKLDSDIRISLWAGTLKALGHVTHLLQDQAWKIGIYD
jgi:hypothetical protein